MHFAYVKAWGVLKQRMGATVPPHTSIGVGPPCRHNRKAWCPGIEPGLQEPDSDADPTEPNGFGKRGAGQLFTPTGLLSIELY